MTLLTYSYTKGALSSNWRPKVAWLPEQKAVMVQSYDPHTLRTLVARHPSLALAFAIRFRMDGEIRAELVSPCCEDHMAFVTENEVEESAIGPYETDVKNNPLADPLVDWELELLWPVRGTWYCNKCGEACSFGTPFSTDITNFTALMELLETHPDIDPLDATLLASELVSEWKGLTEGFFKALESEPNSRVRQKLALMGFIESWASEVKPLPFEVGEAAILLLCPHCRGVEAHPVYC